MNSAEFYIENLGLLPHPEGGFYNEVYRDQSVYTPHNHFTGERNYSTSIYYLLKQGNKSSFHKIKSDEIWHHYDGGCILIYYFENNELITKKLGKNIEEAEQPQLVVPKNTWFAAEPASDCEYALMGCTVAPGFDFQDFDMATHGDLKEFLPKYKSLINRLLHQ